MKNGLKKSVKSFKKETNLSEEMESVKKSIDLLDLVAQNQNQSKRKSQEVSKDSNDEKAEIPSQPSSKKQKKN